MALVRDSIIRHSDLIKLLRQRFFSEKYEQNKDLYDEFDINNVRNGDWHVWRYLRPEKYNVDNSLERMDKALKWRKELGVNKYKPTDAPIEFYQIGGIFPYEKDKNGTLIIFLRVRVNLKVPKLRDLIKTYIAAGLSTIDRETNEEGFVILFDFTDAGLRNVDMDLLFYIISLLRWAYPEGVRYIIIYNIPWILEKFWSMVKRWINPQHQQLVIFVSGDRIFEYVDRDNLPKYMGGNCTKDFTKYPEGCKSVAELASQYGFTNEDTKKYMEIFEEQFTVTRRIVSL